MPMEDILIPDILYYTTIEFDNGDIETPHFFIFNSIPEGIVAVREYYKDLHKEITSITMKEMVYVETVLLPEDTQILVPLNDFGIDDEFKDPLIEHSKMQDVEDSENEGLVAVLPDKQEADTLMCDAYYRCLLYTSGIGVSKALLIVAVCEIAQRLYQIQNSPYIESASDILKIVSHIKNRKREHFVALYLNARHQLIKTYTVSIGSLDASLAHPREVFEPAIRCHASSIIVSHNHPSGDPLPSQQDILLTKRLQHAGELLGIEMLDHIIIAQNGYISMRENKYM